MYDIVLVSPTLSGDSVTAGFTITEAGKPFVDYSVTYHGMDAQKLSDVQAHADKFLSKAKLTGLTYKQMHHTQKDFAKHMFLLGDNNPKNK